ncbi:hypothetical protein ACFS07_14405 [Undibacterium arcticum]
MSDHAAATLFLLEHGDGDEQQWAQECAMFLPRLGSSEAQRYARFTRHQRQWQFFYWDGSC